MKGSGRKRILNGGIACVETVGQGRAGQAWCVNGTGRSLWLIRSGAREWGKWKSRGQLCSTSSLGLFNVSEQKD